MTARDNTIQAERLGVFFKTLGTISKKARKKLETNVLENPDKALEITSNVARAAASPSAKAAL